MPNGPHTPRYSGTHTSWPSYADHCRMVIEGLDKVLRLRMRLGIKYRDVTLLMQVAAELRADFLAWERNDPGDDARGLAIAKLLDLRAQAKIAGAEV